MSKNTKLPALYLMHIDSGGTDGTAMRTAPELTGAAFPTAHNPTEQQLCRCLQRDILSTAPKFQAAAAASGYEQLLLSPHSGSAFFALTTPTKRIPAEYMRSDKRRPPPTKQFPA